MGVFDRAKNVASRGLTAGKSLPKAGKKFGSTLVKEGRKELRDPSSEASRFARAPLGQYYLPKTAQKVGRFIAPTPGGTYRTQEKAVRNPSPKNIGMAALSAAEIASLPLTAGMGARGASAGARVAKRGLAARGIDLASEFGGVKAGRKAAASAGKVKAAQKAAVSEMGDSGAASVAARAVVGKLRGPKPGTSAARAAEAAASDAATTSTMKLSHLSDDVIRQAMSSPTAASKAVKEEFVRRGLGRSQTAAVAPARAARTARNTEIANQMAEAGAKLGLSTKELAQAVRTQGVESVTRQLNKASRMKPAEAAAALKPEQAPVGITKRAAPMAERSAKAAASAARKSGKVKTRKMTAEEMANFDAPKTSAGFDKVPDSKFGQTGVIKRQTVRSGPSPSAVPSSSAAPQLGVNRLPKAKTKAAQVAEKGVEKTEQSLRDVIKGTLGEAKVKRGTYAGLARQFGVSRQRVGEIVAMERKRAAATGAPTATMPEQGSAALGVAKRAASPVSKTNKNVKNSTAAGRVDAEVSKQTINTTPAAKASKPKPYQPDDSEIAGNALNKKGRGAGDTAPEAAPKAANVKGKPKFGEAVVKRIPKKTLAVAGAAVLVANRDKVGIGSGRGSTPAAKSEERAWLKDLPDGLRQDVEALYEVKDQKGEAGLTALVQGLEAARRDKEYENEAERSAPHLSDRYFKDYTKLSSMVGRGMAKEQIMGRVKKRQGKLLRKHVGEAYERTKK